MGLDVSAEDLDKLLYSALHGKLSLPQRRSLVRRFGGWSAFVPGLLGAVVVGVVANLFLDFVKFRFGGFASIGAMLGLIAVLVCLTHLLVSRRRKRFGPRVMSNLKRRGIRPHLCLNCEYDLKGSTADHCPECGMALAPVSVDAADSV